MTRDEFGALAARAGMELWPGLTGIVIPAAAFDAMVQLVEAQSLVVLGLDGFHLDGAFVVPSMDHIADFSDIVGSWDSRVHQGAAAARQVVQDWVPMPDLVEVTLAGLDD